MLVIFLTLNQVLLNNIKYFLGVAIPISVLLLFSLCFILVMLIYFSMKISVLTNQIKDISQYVAINNAELKVNRTKKTE